MKSELNYKIIQENYGDDTQLLADDILHVIRFVSTHTREDVFADDLENVFVTLFDLFDIFDKKRIKRT